MTQENKELLLKDLSARLPYGVFVRVSGDWFYDDYDVNLTFQNSENLERFELGNFELKPYLRPLSSMTDEEKDEFRGIGGVMSYSPQHDHWALCAFSPEGYDWLNSNHFDYRGLIEKGLALEAPEGMYKTK